MERNTRTSWLAGELEPKLVSKKDLAGGKLMRCARTCGKGYSIHRKKKKKKKSTDTSP